MTEADRGTTTRILRTIGQGDPRAAEDLLPHVYAELRKLARALMARVPPGGTLQPTALVHEAYLRLVGDEDPGWNGRGHFFGAAAQSMRQILVDQARRKASRKHGGGSERVDADEVEIAFESPSVDVLALDEALKRLERDHPRMGRLVMLRFFAGLTAEETAVSLGISLRTAHRDWRFARTLLYRELEDPALEARD